MSAEERLDEATQEEDEEDVCSGAKEVDAAAPCFTLHRLEAPQAAFQIFAGSEYVVGRLGFLKADNHSAAVFGHGANVLSHDDMRKINRELCLLRCIMSENEPALLQLENHKNRDSPFLQLVPADGGTPRKPFAAGTTDCQLQHGDIICIGVPGSTQSRFQVQRGGESLLDLVNGTCKSSGAALQAGLSEHANAAAMRSVNLERQPAPQPAPSPPKQSNELLIAVESATNIVGFVKIVTEGDGATTLEGVRALIEDEIDDDVLPLPGWKFMRLQGSTVVPVSSKQEKRYLAQDFLPMVVLGRPQAAQPTPLVTPASSRAPPSAEVETPSVMRPQPPPAPRFSQAAEGKDEDEEQEDAMRSDADDGASKARGKRQSSENDSIALLDDDDDDNDTNTPAQSRTQAQTGSKKKKRKTVEIESSEEELLLSDDDGAGDDDGLEVMDIDSDAGEQVEEVEASKPAEDKDGLAPLFKIDLPSVRAECNALLVKLRDGLEKERQGGVPVRNTDQLAHEIEETITRSALLDTKLGVVGDTGAGKSSLLNALVHEESVLETSGWRACTATVTELSYLHDGEGYVGEIHFLTEEEWEAELKDLLAEALNDEGKLKRVFEGESPQAVAIDKLCTVYGHFTSGQVVTRQMLRHRTQITRRLGEVMVVREADAKAFRKKLAPYVASTDRQSQAYWPIIKRIALRSSNWKVLEQGGVLVDLPGMRDANAARARVCEAYKKECAILLICAPIHRAVDNRTAKDLLGEQFKRQLLLDGQMSNLAFCATKADDVNPTEILKDFDELPEDIRALLDKQDEASDKTRTHKQNLRQLRQARADALAKRKELKKRLRDLQRDLEQADQGKADDDDMEVMLDPEALQEERAKLVAELKELDDTDSMAKEIQALERSLSKLEVQKRHQQREMNAVCARLRNARSKTEIRRDFRLGLMDIKRKARQRARRRAAGRAVEDDDEDDDDEDDDADGLDVDIDLPVFTVAANEYLKTLGKMKADGGVRTFTKRSDTEIPALQRYILSITGERRMQAVHAYLKKVQAIPEAVFWSLADAGTSDKETRKALYQTYCKRKLEAKAKIAAQREKGIRNIKEMTDNTLGSGLAEGAANAEQQVMTTMHSWANQSQRRYKGGPPTNKGIHPSSFRAAMRREGVYTSPTAGDILLNDEMADPILQAIATAWDQILNRKIPRLLTEYKQSLLSILEETFLRDYNMHDLKALCVDQARIDRAAQTWNNQVPRRIDEHLGAILQEVTSQQRTLNRSLPDEVRAAMRPAYQAAACERGGGSTDRARGHMLRHMDRNKTQIFRNAASGMHESLIQLIIQIQKKLQTCEDRCLQAVNGIFSIFWNGPVSEASATTLQERVLPFVTDIARQMQHICSSVDEAVVTFRVDDRLKEIDERRKQQQKGQEQQQQQQQQQPPGTASSSATTSAAAGGAAAATSEVDDSGLAVVQTMTVHEAVATRVAQAEALGDIIDLCDD